MCIHKVVCIGVLHEPIVHEEEKDGRMRAHFMSSFQKRFRRFVAQSVVCRVWYEYSF